MDAVRPSASNHLSGQGAFQLACAAVLVAFVSVTLPHVSLTQWAIDGLLKGHREYCAVLSGGPSLLLIGMFLKGRLWGASGPFTWKAYALFSWIYLVGIIVISGGVDSSPYTSFVVAHLTLFLRNSGEHGEASSQASYAAASIILGIAFVSCDPLLAVESNGPNGVFVYGFAFTFCVAYEIRHLLLWVYEWVYDHIEA